MSPGRQSSWWTPLLLWVNFTADVRVRARADEMLAQAKKLR